MAAPILLFLLAKLIAYTLGFLLGALGSVLQLTAAMRAVLQTASASSWSATRCACSTSTPSSAIFREPPKSSPAICAGKRKIQIGMPRSFWAR